MGTRSLSRLLCALVLAWIAVPASADIVSTNANPVGVTISPTTPIAPGGAVTFSTNTKSSTGAVLTYVWDFGDPNGLTPLPYEQTYTSNRSSTSHKFLYAGNYTVTVKVSEAGASSTSLSATVQVLSASVSGKLLGIFDFKKPNNDTIKLTGTLRLPPYRYCANATFQFAIGANPALPYLATLSLPPATGSSPLTVGNNTICGVVTGCTLSTGKTRVTITTNRNIVCGFYTTNSNCSGMFQVFFKKKVTTVDRVDTRYTLSIKKANLLPAFFDKGISNRTADRESIGAFPLYIGVLGMTDPREQIMVFSGAGVLSGTYNAKAGYKGTLR